MYSSLFTHIYIYLWVYCFGKQTVLSTVICAFALYRRSSWPWGSRGSCWEKCASGWGRTASDWHTAGRSPEDTGPGAEREDRWEKIKWGAWQIWGGMNRPVSQTLMLINSTSLICYNFTLDESSKVVWWWHIPANFITYSFTPVTQETETVWLAANFNPGTDINLCPLKTKMYIHEIPWRKSNHQQGEFLEVTHIYRFLTEISCPAGSDLTSPLYSHS